MKTITADSCGKGKSQKVFVHRHMQQQIISLIYHQDGTDGDKEIAVNEESKNTGNEIL